MEIRRLGPGDREAFEAFLAPQRASSIFLLANSRDAGLEPGLERLQGHYWGAEAAGKLVGVAAQFWNGNLILQAEGRALDALVEAWQREPARPLAGVLGPDGQVARAHRRLGVRPEDLQLDEREGLFHLALDELRLPEALEAGRLLGRRARPGDRALLTRWRVAYSVETLNDIPGPELDARCAEGVERQEAEGRTWVVEEEGAPRATSSFNAALAEVVQIGGVYTPPEHRRRGLGRAAVAASLRDAREEGVEDAVLFTGVENRAAVRAYEALGFRRVGDYRVSLLRPPTPLP